MAYNDTDSVRLSGWDTIRPLGSGSTGAVYEIRRQMYEDTERAALKVISVPLNCGDVEDLYDYGFDSDVVREELLKQRQAVIDRYGLVQKMQGCPYIVRCDDIRSDPHRDRIGWDIFVRMELLVPLYRATEEFISEEMVRRIAGDICRALIYSRQYGIVHGNIHPQNLFYSPEGVYKLGDFSINELLPTSRGGVRQGMNYRFSAPEVYRGSPCDERSDIYSLGLVMYWLLNERRLPFLPLPPERVSYEQDAQAHSRRFYGEPLPPPVHGSDGLKRIILRACAFDSAARYRSAEELLKELDSLQQGLSSSALPTGAAVSGGRNERGAAPKSGSGGSTMQPNVHRQMHMNTPPPLQTDREEFPGDRTARFFNSGEIPRRKAPEPVVHREAGGDPAQEKKPDRKKKPAALWIALGAAAVVVVAAVLLVIGPISDHIRKTERYELALTLLDEGETADAAVVLGTLGDFRDARERSLELWMKAAVRPSIAAGKTHTLVLGSDGSVRAIGNDKYGQCAVEGWSDAIAVAAGRDHSVVLKADGTAAAIGRNDFGQCNVSEWTDIVSIAAGDQHTVGLRMDGTVVAVGWNEMGQCEVSSWTDIIAIAAGSYHTVGLKADGTVVAVGSNTGGQCDVSGWKDIVSIAAGSQHTVALCVTGRVFAAGKNDEGQCNVDGWEMILAIAAGDGHTVALKADGTVVAVGRNEFDQCGVAFWKDIVAIAAGGDHTVCLNKDGKVNAAGWDAYDQCKAKGWNINE